MKKILLTILVGTSLVFTQCNKEDSTDTTKKEEKETPSPHLATA